MHRFFVETALQIGEEVALPADKARQIKSVLRLRPGDEVALFNGDGNDYTARLIGSPGGGLVEIVGSRPARSSGPPELSLALALIKADKFDWVVQKATELGVVRFIPLESANAVVSLRVDRARQRLDRWRRIAIEAAEQSGRATIPVFEPVTTFDRLLEQESISDAVMLSERETARRLDQIVAADLTRLTLLVGPEGGFSPGEVESFTQAAGRTVTLGPLILRSETAAIAGLAAVNALVASRNMSS